MFSFNAPIKNYASKVVYKKMNLETKEVHVIIKIYETLSKTE